MEGFSWLLAQS